MRMLDLWLLICKSIRYIYIYIYKHLQRAGCPRGVMVKALGCGIVVCEFELLSRYYGHFWTNPLGKGMNPLPYPPSYGLNSTTTVPLNGRIWH